MKRVKVLITLALVFLIITLFSQNKLFIAPLSPSLSIGSTGEDVEQIQQKLKNCGYFTGNVDGRYDRQTSEAIKVFQRKYGLKDNGIADADTIMAMGLTMIAETGAAYAEGNGTGDEQLLARAINGEARGESYIGQVAVGAVILNRTRDPKFPKTIAGVIYQPGAFTAVSDGQINVALETTSTVVKAARDALNGWDPTNGCIYYYNPATATSSWIWGRQIVTKIGKHNFAK